MLQILEFEIVIKFRVIYLNLNINYSKSILMKSILVSLVACLMLVQIYGQRQDFQLEFKLRFENQKVYCDVVPTKDYLILGMQFGIHHNSDFVIFDTAYSNVFEFTRKIFNEICPKNVRFVWTSPKAQNIQLIQNVPFLTLEYTELIPSDHFICMMPSLSPSCTTMIREAFYDSGNDIVSYGIPDVCVDYRIQDGAIILGNVNQDRNKNYQINYRPLDKTLDIDPDLDSREYQLHILSPNGACLYQFEKLNKKQRLALTDLSAGLYIYSIHIGKNQIQSGKFVVLE